MKPAIVLACVSLGACAPIAESQVAKVNNFRVQDAIGNYEAASRSGDPLDMCVKAKLVAAAYDEAREAVSAEAWRAREREACQLAVKAMGIAVPGE